MRTHQEIDARSLELHRLCAQKIRENPALLRVVRANIVLLLERSSPRGRGYILEWKKAVDEGIDACLRLAAEDSEHGATLRQSSPFAGVIGQEERLEFFRRWKATHDTRAA